MTPTEIKQTLSRLGGRANKKLGQHFLIDKAALAAVVNAADVKPGDRVLEIGPGLGVLTNALLERGASVTAIEQDRRFVEWLSGRGEPMRSPSEGRHMGLPLRLIHGDAATIHWHDLVEDGVWKFVSNLPYSITSLALRKALWAPRPPEAVVVLVQREVAERAIAKDGKTSLLSLMVALASSSAKIIKRVPAGAFFPPPKVESAILQIIPMPWEERQRRWGIDPEKIMEVAKRGFAHPRKLLASNLNLPGRGEVTSPLRQIGIPEKSRAEDISPEQWAKLAQAVTAASLPAR